MAICVNVPKVWQTVYKHGTPQKPGVIMSVDSKKSKDFMVHVKWLDGSITSEFTCGLKDFGALIADHQKKLNTHQHNLRKLKALDPEYWAHWEICKNPPDCKGNCYEI
jgi:hypothetical protein